SSVRRFVRLLSAALFLMSWLGAGSARAALVLFEDGRHLHVKDFEVVEDEVSLRFEEGGSMTISLDRVSRIIDDEFDHPPPPVSVLVPEAKKRPARSVRTSARPAKLGTTPYDSLILAAAKEHRIDPALIAAVIRAESN